MAAEANQVVGPAGEGALVIIPTYNELENLPIIVDRLLTAMPGVHVLVVDDNSPDGTGPLADQLAANDADQRIFVLHRTEKNGLGGAYLAGFDWGLARDYVVFVEMDADGSHAPEQLHRLFDRINSGADMVAGSRYIPGGSVVNWPWHRQFISRGGNIYSRLALGVKFNDITGGYRAYRRAVLEKIDLGSIESYGYCFQIDLAWRTMLAGFTVAEVPITFTERELGESKMSGGIFQEAFVKVGKWGMSHRIARLRGQAPKIR